MGVMNFIFGGIRGYSDGKSTLALKQPPPVGETVISPCTLDRVLELALMLEAVFPTKKLPIPGQIEACLCRWLVVYMMMRETNTPGESAVVLYCPSRTLLNPSFPALAPHRQLSLTVESSTLIIKHEHDLPLKDVAVDQSAANPGNVLVGLHLLELSAQEDRC